MKFQACIISPYYKVYDDIIAMMMMSSCRYPCTKLYIALALLFVLYTCNNYYTNS